jgi:hypothetical protein
MIGPWLLLVLLAPGCGVTPAKALKDHLNTTLPPGVRVANFTGDAFKDPWFAWEIQPVSRTFIKTLTANAGLAPAPAGADLSDPTLLPIPPWWPRARLPSLREVYVRDPGPADGSVYRVWVDPENNRIYILFMNT